MIIKGYKTSPLTMFCESAVPDASNAMPYGLHNVADVASPSSPLKLPDPVPAMVDIIPVDTVTLRMRLLLVSLMYTLPRQYGNQIIKLKGSTHVH